MRERDEFEGAAEFLRERRQAEEEAAFVAQLAPVLRAPERLPDDFEARLLARMRADRDGPVTPLSVAAASRVAPWWRRSRSVRVSPLAGLAWAAGFAGLVATGTLAAARSLRAPLGPAEVAATGTATGGSPARTVAGAVRVDTVHMVRFVIEARDARRVALVGDFNGWAAGATPLTPTARDGVWTVDVALPAGRHEYAFEVDGTRWVADPLAAPLHDDFGTVSSVVTVGGTMQARS
jgi:hypothetical protein